MVYKSGQIFLPFCHNSRVWQTDRRTDKQTDRILIARPRLHSMQGGKKRTVFEELANQKHCHTHAHLYSSSTLPYISTPLNINLTIWRMYFDKFSFRRHHSLSDRVGSNVAEFWTVQSATVSDGRFRCKIALRLKKVCYQISLCENCQRQGCKAFIGLTIRAKMIGGATPST